MKKTAIIVLLCVAIAISGCGFRLVKKPVQPEIATQSEDELTIKIGSGRKMHVILQDILANGEIIDKDVHARKLGEYDYSWEMWVIKETTGDYHAVVIENGKLLKIAPVNSLEDARMKFQPYGGWDK